jgi:hypothetical protein
MRPSGNPVTETATNPPTCAEGLIWQLNERIVLLVLTESHADLVSAMRAGTDRFWVDWSPKHQMLW